MCRQNFEVVHKDSKGFSCSEFKFQYYFIALRQPAEIKTMLKELALLVTLLMLLADARPQRFQVCYHWGHKIDHWDDFVQEPLNDLDEMSEEVDINGPQRFDNGDLLDNNDDNIGINSLCMLSEYIQDA